jgi:hypothetical protein
MMALSKAKWEQDLFHELIRTHGRAAGCDYINTPDPSSSPSGGTKSQNTRKCLLYVRIASRVPAARHNVSWNFLHLEVY